jgi:hypothetical protein
MSDEPIVLAPGAGRAYDLGTMCGVFKADGPVPGGFEADFRGSAPSG